MARNFKHWTLKELEKLELLASTGDFSWEEMGKELDRTGIACALKGQSLKISNSKYIKKLHTKYFWDENFWQDFNLTNCYWAGFCLADAYIYEPRNTFKIELGNTERGHLEKFKEITSYTGPIRKSNRGQFSISLNSEKWIKDLKNFNLDQKKSYRISPPHNLTWEMSIALLIGYTDGDGTICLSKGKNGLLKFHFKWSSCSESMIKWIFDIIENKMEIYKFKIQQFTRKKTVCSDTLVCKSFSISGIQAAILFDYLRSFSIYKMPRKWDRPEILQYVEIQKQKYPEKFKGFNEQIQIILEKQEKTNYNNNMSEKINELNQIHGQLPSETNETNASQPWGGARTLDDILGRQVLSKYKQKTPEEYTQFLASLDLMDLRDEAGRIGIIPNPDIKILRRNLMDRFIEAQVPYSPLRPQNQQDKNILPAELRIKMGGE